MERACSVREKFGTHSAPAKAGSRSSGGIPLSGKDANPETQIQDRHLLATNPGQAWFGNSEFRIGIFRSPFSNPGPNPGQAYFGCGSKLPNSEPGQLAAKCGGVSGLIRAGKVALGDKVRE